MKEKDKKSGQRLWAAIPGADKAAFFAVKDLPLLSYKGMDSFGSGLSIGWIIQTVLGTYKSFVKLLAMPGAFGYLTLPMAVFQISK